MSTPFGIEIANNGANGAQLRVSGEVDMASTGLLVDTIMSLAPDSMHEVIVDLGNMTFIDSTGLSGLVSAHRRLAERQVRLVVINASSRTLELMRITGIEGVLNIERAVTPERLSPSPGTSMP